MIVQADVPVSSMSGGNYLAQDPHTLQEHVTSLLQPIARDVDDMFTEEQSFFSTLDRSHTTLKSESGFLLMMTAQLTSSTSFIVPMITDKTESSSSEEDILTSLDIDSGNVPSAEPT
jgi:hypothetical protein